MIGATSPTQSGKDNCSLQLTTVGNSNLLLGGTARAAVALNLLDKVHAVLDLTEDDVSAVKPAGNDGGDEELGAVGVLAGVGHGEQTGLVVLQLEVLIREPVTVDGLATSAVALGEITTLQHELGDDAVEAGTLVTESLLTSAESTEVLNGLGDDFVEQLEGDAASRLAINGDIEESLDNHGC